MAKELDSDILVSEFGLQSRYNAYFRTNSFGNIMNPPLSS